MPTRAEERIERIRADRWISFDRAAIVLERLTALVEMPRQGRMPGLMVYGDSGIGKTMIAKRMAAHYPARYDQASGTTTTPILLVQAPPAPDERRFYQHLLASIGAPLWGRHTVSELEVRALAHLREMGLRVIMIDEVHNLLAGTYREQRRFLNMLRFLSNDLSVSLVVFGVNDAAEAIRGDDQLARRLDEHFLPLWEDDAEFSRLIQTLIKAMDLERPSHLDLQALRHVLGVSGGVTSRVFTMVKALAIEAIETGEERITSEAVRAWRPVWSRHPYAGRLHAGRVPP